MVKIKMNAKDRREIAIAVGVLALSLPVGIVSGVFSNLFVIIIQNLSEEGQLVAIWFFLFLFFEILLLTFSIIKILIKGDDDGEFESNPLKNFWTWKKQFYSMFLTIVAGLIFMGINN